MKLTHLFEKQAQLDAHIVEKHGLQGQDLLQKKVLALTVELAELAQEHRGFKFWSIDQQPRNFCKLCQLTETPHDCRNPLLEEYVDCLHFALSIGNELGYCRDTLMPTPNVKGSNVLGWIHMTMQDFINFNPYNENGNWRLYGNGIRNLLALSEMLGFTWEQVEEAYNAKHEVNYKRQQEGY